MSQQTHTQQQYNFNSHNFNFLKALCVWLVIDRMSAQQRADAARAAAAAAFAALNPSNPSSLPASLFPALALMLSLGLQYSEQEASIISTALSEMPLGRFVAWYEMQLQLEASRAASPGAFTRFGNRTTASAADSGTGAEAASLEGGTAPAAATEHAAPTTVNGSNPQPVQAQQATAAADVDASTSASNSGTTASAAASSPPERFQMSLELSAPNFLDRSGTAASHREQRGLLAAAWLAAYDELLTVPTAFLIAESDTTEVACTELDWLQDEVMKYFSANHVQACMAITAERVLRLKVRWTCADMSFTPVCF
jgi:hypothetical protein